MNAGLVFKAVFFCICLVITSEGCGILTHMIISFRAKDFFNEKGKTVDYKQLISKHTDAFQAGSAFPDSFYSNLCNNGNYSHVSEDTHWTPFLKTAVDYIRDKYPQPWDDSTEKLVVFLFGIMSHQVADVVWHSLDIQQGFIPTLAAVDFHGNYSLAHEAADLGGDVVVAWEEELEEDVYPFDDWYVPTEDLFNIYKQYYGSVIIDPNTIDSCSTLLVLASIGEIYGLPELFQVVSETTPFLGNNMEDYFLGGINDMMGWTFRSWENGVSLLENGTNACDLPHNPLFIHCKQTSNSLPKETDPQTKNSFFVQPDLHGLTIDDLEVTQEKKGISIKTREHVKKNVQRIMKDRSKTKAQKVDQNPLPNYGVYAVNSSYARFGWALTSGDLDQDGFPDVVIGAPGYGVPGNPQEGRVYIVYGNDSDSAGFDYYNINLDLHYWWNRLEDHTTVIPGFANKQSRFGSGVAVLDINMDGILDLAIGAPAYYIDNALEYKGLISIYLGKGKGNRKYEEVDIAITCQTQYCNLGYNLEAGDLNGDGNDDLIIGLPFYSDMYNQSGIVAGLMASKDVPVKKTIDLKDITWRQRPQQEQPFAWFGFNMYSKSQTLKVSSPNVRKCMDPNCKFSIHDKQETGRADIFNYGHKTAISNQTIIGTSEHESAGFSLDFGYLYDSTSLILAVGYPGMTVEGVYWTLPVNITRAGTVVLYNVTGTSSVEVARFEGNTRYGRFGSLVKITDVNGDGMDDLIIGEPNKMDDKAEVFDSVHGMVYAYYGGKDFPKGRATFQHCGITKPCPKKSANFDTEGTDYIGVHNGYKAEVLKTKADQILFTSDIRYPFSEDVVYAGNRCGGVHHYYVNRK